MESIVVLIFSVIFSIYNTWLLLCIMRKSREQQPTFVEMEKNIHTILTYLTKINGRK